MCVQVQRRGHARLDSDALFRAGWHGGAARTLSFGTRPGFRCTVLHPVHVRFQGRGSCAFGATAWWVDQGGLCREAGCVAECAPALPRVVRVESVYDIVW